MAIAMACGCGKRFKARDSAAGKKVRCPACQTVLAVPSGNIAPPDRFPLILALIGSLGLLVVLVMWQVHTSNSLNGQIKESERQRSQAEHDLASTQKERQAARLDAASLRKELAQIKVSVDAMDAIKTSADRARQDAVQMKKEAERTMMEAREMMLREEENLESVYPNLRKLKNGKNIVHIKYVDSFEIVGVSAKVTMANVSKRPLYPGFSIRLIDRNGFFTDEIFVHWSLTTLDPGSTYTEEKPLNYQHGKPVYYKVVMEDLREPAVAETERPAGKLVNVGDDAVIEHAGAQGAFLANDKGWDALQEALRARDEVGVAGLMVARQVVYEKNGAIVKVLATSFTSYKVRIMQGDNLGWAGWIDREFLSPR